MAVLTKAMTALLFGWRFNVTHNYVVDQLRIYEFGTLLAIIYMVIGVAIFIKIVFDELSHTSLNWCISLVAVTGFAILVIILVEIYFHFE